jgi:hypothetical protein
MDRALPAASTFATSPLFETAMSLEDRFRQALTDAISEVKTRLEAEFDAAFTDVKAEADRDRTAALALADEARVAAVAEARGVVYTELQAAFDSEKTSLAATHEAQLAQAADAARLEASRLNEAAAAESERRRQEAEAALASVKADAEATVEAIRSELREAQVIAVRQREEGEATIARLQSESEATVEAVRTELREAQQAAAQQREQAEASTAQLRDEFEQTAARMRADFDGATAQARELAEAALLSLRAEAQEAATLHSRAVDAHETGALRMLESVRALDGATSLTEVLDALTLGASKEAGRAAVLVVKGERLIGWRTIGFGAYDREPRALESSTSDVGALAAAVNTGRPAVTGSGSVLAPPPFSEAPADRPGLAVPLLVAGRPVAVLYADPGTSPTAAGWTSPVEVLVRHAARCLEGLAVQRATAGRAGTARVAASA